MQAPLRGTFPINPDAARREAQRLLLSIRSGLASVSPGDTTGRERPNFVTISPRSARQCWRTRCGEKVREVCMRPSRLFAAHNAVRITPVVLGMFAATLFA